MSRPVWLLIVCALVFGLCFLVDRLVQKLAPKHRLEKSRQAVRPHHLCCVAGIILLAFPVLFLLGNGIPEKDSGIFIAGCITSVLMSLVLLGYYFSFAVFYDEEGFLYRTLLHGKREFTYAQIRGQRSLMTRSGIHTVLFVGDTEIELTTTNQNVAAFLNKAFYRWCEAKGIDPDSVENNPRMLTWFPDPDAEETK